MIKISVFHPNEEGKRFDMDYYCDKHVTMFQEKVGAACKKVCIDKGLSGGEPGTKAPYVAVGHFYFDSLESFQASFAPHIEAIKGDIVNFSEFEPIVQISEVKL